MKLEWPASGRTAWIQGAIVLIVASLFGLGLSKSLQSYGLFKNTLLLLVIPLVILFIQYPDKAQFCFRAMFFFLPVVGFEIPPRDIVIFSIFDVLLFLTILFYFIQSCELGFRPNTYRHLRMPLLLLLLSCTISSVYSQEKALAFYDIYLNLKYAAFYWMFVELVETTHDLRIICGLMLFGFVGCVAFGLVQNYLGIGVNLYEFQDTGNTTYEDLGEKFTRVTGPFSNSTEMAQYLLIPLFLALGMVIDAKRWWVKAAMLVLFAAGGWVLLLTLTRCPIAAFAIVLGAVILRRTGPLVLTGMALVGFLLFYLGTEFPNLVDLLLPAGLGARSGDVSSDFFDIRIPLWTAAIDIFKQSPFFGIGFRNLLDPLPYYVPGANWLDFYRNTVGLSPIETLHEGHVQVDSTWFTWLPEMGAIGLGLVFFIVGRVVKNLYFLYRKSRDPEISSLAFAFGTGFVAVLINMIANYAYTNYGCGIMMWSCLGVSTVLGRMNANLEAPGAGFKAEARQKNPDPPVPQPV